MKRLFINLILALMVLSSGLTFQSCHNDKEPQVEPTNFRGIWDLEYEEITRDGHREVYNTIANTDIFIEFFHNGDFDIYRSASDNPHVLLFIDRPENRGYWSLSGTVLTLKYDDGFEDVWDITSLTENYLRLRYVPFEDEKVEKRRDYKRIVESEFSIEYPN
ncbi:MAG: lipocalin family protein [Bacteroidales bacterium]|nr:lipocalin family protein [Bacteroidales bacterium]